MAKSIEMIALELYESEKHEELKSLLSGRTHSELTNIAITFEVLTSYAEDAPRSIEE
jgi:hypothetical protein